ncbi:uncharacterized protein [Pyxicephalus adspersus]|uniref:uncharacterized protein n=1 Tax=Pyxicephalus adspersus TaxID=30357 RepID=UPI003B5B5D89
MFSAGHLLFLMICGCWTLPLPYTTTLVWSVLDNEQNQFNLLCLVNTMPAAIITMWISNTNEASEIISDGIQMIIIPASTTQRYFLTTLKSDQSPVFAVPSYVGCFFFPGNIGFHFSKFFSANSLSTIFPPTSLNMPLHSVMFSLSSSKQAIYIIPSPFHHSSFIFQSVFSENDNSDPLTSNSQQYHNIQIGHLVLAGNFHNFTYLSLLIQRLKTQDSTASFFLTETESVNLDDTLAGESNHALCYNEDFSLALALRMKQDFLLVLAIRILAFKLLIFDLLVTWIGMLQKYRLEKY